MHIKSSLHIYIEHRNLETRKTPMTSYFSYKTFYYLLSLKVLRHKVRDTHSFYSGFFICPPPSRAYPSQGLREQAKVNHLLPRQDSTPLGLFQNPPRASGARRHQHSVAPFPIWAIVTSLSDMSAPPVRVNTCVNVAPE